MGVQVKKCALLIATLVACGDNIIVEPDATPFTYGDAQLVWANSWCFYAERCQPERFNVIYGTHNNCQDLVYRLNCHNNARCTLDFDPNLRDDLQMCEADMYDVGCDATVAPGSCIAALR